MDGHDSPFENGQKNMVDGGRPTGNNCRGINYPFNFRTKSSHPTGRGHVVLLSGGRKCREGCENKSVDPGIKKNESNLFRWRWKKGLLAETETEADKEIRH